MEALYRGRGCLGLHAQQKEINVHITHKGWVPPISVLPEMDLSDPDLVSTLRARIEHTCGEIDRKLAAGK